MTLHANLELIPKSYFLVPCCLLSGSQGSGVMQQYILQAAVYIANLFFLTSDTSATIVKDSDIDIHKLGMM